MHKSPEVVVDNFKYSGILRPGKVSQKSIIIEGIKTYFCDNYNKDI